MLKTYYIPTLPNCINCFWVILYSFLDHTTPHHQPFVVVAYLCLTRSVPPLPARNAVHLDVVHTRPPPASADCLCASRRMPVSVVVPFPFAPPLPPLDCTQVPDRLWGFNCTGPYLVYFLLLFVCGNYTFTLNRGRCRKLL